MENDLQPDEVWARLKNKDITYRDVHFLHESVYTALMTSRRAGNGVIAMWSMAAISGIEAGELFERLVSKLVRLRDRYREKAPNVLGLEPLMGSFAAHLEVLGILRERFIAVRGRMTNPAEGYKFLNDLEDEISALNDRENELLDQYVYELEQGILQMTDFRVDDQ